ncbi:hypothetical protein O6H91_07G043000 [Diphasiastrum complanatum]|uniref:Uncharacterized protein n=1 Tax=Diphasiastrum complanatum TaxID=34168 RepID=A0ACC2D4H6_DIPCM|nr:hypothetical protein O6H91_07G043000 [Diphasiastrum complanatum]
MATSTFLPINVDVTFRITDAHEMHTKCSLKQKNKANVRTSCLVGSSHLYTASSYRGEKAHAKDCRRRIRHFVAKRGLMQKNRASLLKVVASTVLKGFQESIFPSFLPSDVQNFEEQTARELASRIQQLPVQTSLAKVPIMTSCVVPIIKETHMLPVLLLHGFDSSCLEWRNTYPLLEQSGSECWAMDILGWGFSTSAEPISSYNVKSKREHLYKFWKTYIRKPVALVGASLGGATAIDFCLHYPKAVRKLVLIDAQGYSEGLGHMANLPRILAYAGVAVLKNVLLRTYANRLIYSNISWRNLIDAMRIGRLHCLMPSWEDATVDFMLSGGYNVASSICQVQQEVLVVWGEQDKIFPKHFAKKFERDLPNARLELISDCGHFPHVEKPNVVAPLITTFVKEK